MDGTVIMTAISTVGFPIVVAMYTLTTLNKTMQENTKVLTQVLEKLTELPIKEVSNNG